MIEEYYIHLYTKWKSQKGNEENSWIVKKTLRFKIFAFLFALSCAYFLIMSIVFLLSINNIHTITLILFLTSIVTFIVSGIKMGSIDKNWRDKYSYSNFNKYLAYCIKLQNDLINDINCIKLYERILNKTKESRVEIETSSRKPNELVIKFFRIVVIALLIAFTTSITNSYLGTSFVVSKAAKVLAAMVLLAFVTALAWMLTYANTFFDNNRIQIRKEMERDFQTIIDLHNGLFGEEYKEKIQFSSKN